MKLNLKEINKEINNLISLAKLNPLKSILGEIEKLEKQKASIEQKLNSTAFDENKVPFEKIKDILSGDIKQLKNGSKLEIKKLINKYIKKIIVYDDKITIDYTFNEIEDILNITQYGSPRPYIFKTQLEVVDFISKLRRV